jgi:hypothetical protein
MTGVAAPVPATTTRSRRIALAVLASLMAGLTGLVMGAVPALVGGFVAGEQEIHLAHMQHWGALMGVLVAVPLVALAVRPRVAPLQQVAVVVAAFLAVQVAAGILDPAAAVFVVLFGALAVLHPARRELLRRGEGLDPVLGALAATATIPLLVYAWGELQHHLHATPGDPHLGPPEYHYLGGAALGVAVAAIAWLAAVRTDGWRVPAWTVGAAMVLLGLGSVLHPRHTSSFGRAWGAAALVWGVAFGVAVLVRRRRETAP